MLYFAFGSNLDEAQMQSRCANARPLLHAVLEDHLLVFRGFSRTRQGGVASVDPAPGRRVEGLLYELDDEALGSLDHFEGYPRHYDRAEREVRDAEGRRRRALLYVKPPERFALTRPSDAYVEVIRREYERRGFDLAALAAAAEVGS